jgi:phage baseplate assembly protein V
MNEIIEYRERFASLNPTFRVGIVQQQDPAHAKVRVVFPDYDEMISWWLPVVFAKTQDDKVYWIPDIGEQVVCLMDLRDEAGAVLGAIYSSADTPPVNSANKFHLGFKDGAHFDYDRVAHIQIDSSGNVIIQSAGQVRIGNGPLLGVARLGDQVQVGEATGTIVSASIDVLAG